VTDAPWFRWDGEDLILRIRVQPRSSREGIAGPEGDRLKVRLHAPPVEGEANESLIAIIAKGCGVPRRQVELIRGQKSRDKDLRVGSPNRLPEGVTAS
jgi:uncharacterized protein (TIGR00251 family)